LLLLPQDPVALLQENPQILLNLGESNVEDSAEVGSCGTTSLIISMRHAAA
jgi:hypothetical protein